MEQEYIINKASVWNNLMERSLEDIEEIREKAELHLADASYVGGVLVTTRFSEALKSRISRAELVSSQVLDVCDEMLDIRSPRTRLSRNILSGVATLFRKGGANG